MTALKIKKVRFKVDKLKTKMPLFGKLMITIYTSLFARTLCSLYTSGISIVNVLNIAKTTIGNVYIESQFDGAIKKIRNGETLSQSLKDIDGFDVKLNKHLNEWLLWFNQLWLFFLALVICLIIISALLPIYTLYNNVGNM